MQTNDQNTATNQTAKTVNDTSLLERLTKFATDATTASGKAWRYSDIALIEDAHPGNPAFATAINAPDARLLLIVRPGRTEEDAMTLLTQVIENGGLPLRFSVTHKDKTTQEGLFFHISEESEDAFSFLAFTK